MKTLLYIVLFTAFIYSKSVEAVKITKPIKLDAKLDEKHWSLAKNIGQFTQKDPVQFEPSSDSTDIRFLFDDKYFYIGIKVFKSNKIVAIKSRRDNMQNSERIIIALDPYNNNRNSFSFGITATGVRAEYFHASDSEYDRDYAFNPVWEAKSEITEFGWQAEARIPLSQLRFNEDGEGIWGVNLNHWAPDNREDNYWLLIPKDENGWASRFGDLTGFKGLKQPKRIETMPYFAQNANYNGIGDQLRYKQKSWDFKPKIGLDVKAGIGSNVTIDATINPDFGQVEADPAQVNLTGFEIRFSERRPFFTEGRNLFDLGGREFFYSRRIGARPSYQLGVSDTTFNPIWTDILGAAKITGRTESGLQFGVLTSATDQMYGFYQDSLGNEQSKVVEPYSFYNVFTGLKEFNNKQSAIGFILTSANRMNSDNQHIREVVNNNAYSGAVEWNHRFDNLTYEFDGHLGFSHIDGSKESILVDQLANQRYYQRPGLDYIEVDSNRTNLNGYTGRIRLDKKQGNWVWGTGLFFDSPGFEINDLGFYTRPDRINYAGNVSWRDLVPKKVVRDYNIYGRIEREWDFGGNITNANYTLRSTLTTLTNNRFSAEYTFFERRNDQRAARGGPLVLRSPMHNASFSYNTDWSKPIRFETSLLLGVEQIGSEIEFTSKLSMQFFGNLDISFSPYYRRRVDPWQYVTTQTAAHNNTFGNRYVFAQLDQTFLSLITRANFALTPDMTLEFYAEPFISHGKFRRYGEMEEAFTGKFIEYGDVEPVDGTLNFSSNNESIEINNPDFNVVSLRTNLVYRWEYIPGSILFFVWQQNRRDDLMLQNSFRPEDVLGSFSALGTHSFTFKFSYWFNAGSLL